MFARALYLRILTVCSLVLCLGLVQFACWDVETVGCSPDDSTSEANEEFCDFGEAVAVLWILQNIGFGPGWTIPVPDTNLYCSTDVSNPIALDVGVYAAGVPAGGSCYYRYTSPANNSRPLFTLKTISGNADLYVGLIDDFNGGVPGASTCSDTAPGEGWIRCMRTTATAESINTNAAGVQQMDKNAYRIFAVYGSPLAGGPSSFSIAVQ